jgi:hydrogenase maturation protease
MEKRWMSCGETDNATLTATGTLIIGYGNPLRGDDGAGPALAELVEELLVVDGVRTTTCLVSMQLTPEMADDLSRFRRVVFVDASFEVQPGKASVTRIGPREQSSALGHLLSPEALLALSQEAFGICPEAWVAAVGVSSMELGETLSADVASAVERLAGHVRHWVAQWDAQDRDGAASVDVEGAV